MEEWGQLVGQKAFISDLGENQKVLVGGIETGMGRYAVWSPTKEQERHSVVEVGSDLLLLRQKYNIPEERVLQLVTREACSHG